MGPMRRTFSLNLLLPISLMVLTALAPLGASASHQMQTGDAAEELLAEMTVEERVGQLFLVTFEGSTAPAESKIETLIRDHHISGVALRSGNDNFAEGEDMAEGLRALTEGLQRIEFEGSTAAGGEPTAFPGPESKYVPLLIGIRDEAEEVPLPQFIPAMSSLPSQMAIGASWDPTLAEQVGAGLGEELAGLGINLYLGPSLDVLEEPALGGPGDLGSRSFGGDPYWVSEMGAAYVRGMHVGSRGRVAVIATHFPGYGGSDRPLQEEVATIRKSIDQLLQIELPPFFSVTDAAPGDEERIADGLLVSHIRYQGFQGNIRATTRPISLDPDAYAQLMALEPIQSWREQGGVTVSDSLGSRAIRRFRDPLEQEFQPQLVARDALIAGNDLLLLGNIRSPEDPDQLTTIRSILSFFAQKYREDSVFAQRVDEAALRVLRLKLRLYGGTASLARVTPSPLMRNQLGDNEDVAFTVLRQAATLISPDPEEVANRLGGPPQLDERVVFITDPKPIRRCSECPVEPTMAVDALERRITSLYGPGAAGQVGAWNLWSFSTADLASYLGVPPDTTPEVPLTPPEELDEPLRTADWLIFSIMDAGDTSRYGAGSLQSLLENRPDLVRDKKVVVFGFDVPYSLDATNLSKVDVYYSLYAASEPAVDVAARLLFDELPAPGSPPVSVPGIGYDLINALQPIPSQVLSLSIEAVVGDGTPTPDVESGFTQGALVRISTAPIVDTNGHLVPDNTPVEFLISQPTENITQTIEAVTVNGIAEITFRLDRLGLFVIEARSGQASRSDVLQLNVQEGVPAFPTVIAPTAMPTATSAPTETVPPATVVPTEGEEGGGGELDVPPRVAGPWDLLFGLLGVGLVVSGSYFYLSSSEPWLGSQVRCALIAAVGGLLGYNYVALGLPGTPALLDSLRVLAGLLLAVVGGIGAMALYAGWLAMDGKGPDSEE